MMDRLDSLRLPDIGNPKRGGTLRYFGPGGMDHLDPACASYAFSHQIIRLYTRQLFAYPTTPGLDALVPVPDLAESVKVTGKQQRRWLIKIRDDAYWDTRPSRRVTAEDVVRGLKRIACPTTGSGGLAYFTSTILGFSEFAAAYREAMAVDCDRAGSAAHYQDSSEVPGLRVVDDRTIEIELSAPANDFTHILATLYASPAPKEYNCILPGESQFWRHAHSCGPYRVESYDPGSSLRLGRNPAWTPESDPLRGGWVDRIDVRIARVSDDTVRSEIETGKADLSWGAPVTEHRRTSPDGDRHVGFALNPYLAFNLYGTSPFVTSQALRSAAGAVIDRTSLVHLMNDMDLGTVTEPAERIIPPNNVGYQPNPRSLRLGASRARSVLRDVEFQRPVRILRRVETPHDDIAESYARDLEGAGVPIEFVTVQHADEYYRILQDPAYARSDVWDITAPAWTPDWFGNNGRTYIQPLVGSPTGPGSCNYGGFSDPKVDFLIDRALSAESIDEASRLWSLIDDKVCESSAIVPLLVCEPTILHLTSGRVRNAIPMPHVDRWYDAANVWIM